MDDKEQIIPYRSVPRWIVPAVGGTCAFGAAVVIFMSTSLALLVFPGWGLPHATFVVLETFVRAVAVLILGLFAFLAYEVARHDRLILSEEGWTFPLFLAPDLLFRRKRKWDDLANILVGVMLLEDKKGTYEYELEKAKDKKKVFIYFKSGGHAALDLSKVPRDSQEQIFKAIESFCIACTRAPQPGEPSRKKKGGQKAKPLSYTQMWEDELEAHFSATNFVPLEKGRSLQSGKFTVLMQLSSGGLSAVYLAETPTRELILVKEAVLPQSLEDKTRLKAKELFQREAYILRQLNHPKIAKVLDFFVERGRDYLILEFVAGESLRQIVKKRGTQSERVVLNVALQIGQILDYLHDQQPPVVHRDITPDNIILKDNDEVVLIDFGAANQYLGTATGTLVGKQCYMAAEQFRGKACVQSDYYGLGCTLYFLLTGEDPEALSMSHPKDVRQDVSDELSRLVGDLTAMELENRVKSATELIERVEKLIPDTVLSFSGSESH